MAAPENIVAQAAAKEPVTAAHAAVPVLEHPVTTAPVTSVITTAAPVGTLIKPGGIVAKPQPAPAPIPVVARINLKRIPSAVDPLGSSAVGLGTTLDPFRLAATSKVFVGLQRIKNHIGLVLQTLQQPNLPPNLIGALHQPDGSAAARVQVTFQPSSIGLTAPAVIVLTADDGGFTLAMPSGVAVPQSGISLMVHGSNVSTTVAVPSASIAANGMIGVLTLSVTLDPLPTSIVSSLLALIPTPSVATTTASSNGSTAKPQVTIGEPGSVCVQSFGKAPMVDKFPWGIFFRLVEPQMSIVSQTQTQAGAAGKIQWLPIYVTQQGAPAPAAGTQSSFVDRIPVDQPLSVDGFRDQVAGIDTNGNFTADETVPMAASLGLGYVLQMSQQWTFEGLGLGNLVYSLPLAPGEQQQVAVFERQDTSAVQESEFFTESSVMNQTALADTSTNATFNSAFNEVADGGSAFQTHSSSSSWGASGGFSLGIISAGGSGGGGTSDANGTSTNWLQGQRDATEQATQSTHSAAENQASARVTASRTGMRLATASENMDVTTKIITNHNHTRALTIQYWEVHRIYDVTTAIDGLSLVCLVPMQVVRFMPPGQPATLSDPSTVSSHGLVLERYKNILRHLDVLQLAVPRNMRHGLELLAQFASDPTTVVDSSGSVAEDVISLKIQGTFLQCERISVAAVTKRNTRVGPVQLSSAVSGQPTPIPENQFASQDQLVAWLTLQRDTSSSTLLQGSLALPGSLNRSDIIGFEITRQFDTVSCTLIPPVVQAIDQLLGIFGTTNQAWEQSSGLLGPNVGVVPQTIKLTAANLENLLGGPEVSYFSAAIEDLNAGGASTPAAPNETYANDNLSGTVLPPQPFPVPALQIAPVLRYKDILEIERTAQHIVRNTTRYSRALWMSMTPEERAILIDGYTIGVPDGGLTDASQMIPLLNCVQNKVLGTFGNSLIMPFIIPQGIAEMMQIDPTQLQQALLNYQKVAFDPPHSTVALPTRGVLGEAVLGHCQSAEKIDLTRFWNWQDAPADTAPGIGEVQLPTTTPPLTTGVTAPNSLTNLPPLINNLIAPPQPNTSLLTAMGQQATGQQDFSTNLTGQTQLGSIVQNAQTQANSARSDALKTSQTLASQAMTTVGGLISQAMGSGQQTAKQAGKQTGTTTPGTTTPGAGTTKGGTKTGTATGTSTGQQQQASAQSGGGGGTSVLGGLGKVIQSIGSGGSAVPGASSGTGAAAAGGAADSSAAGPVADAAGGDAALAALA